MHFMVGEHLDSFQLGTTMDTADIKILIHVWEAYNTPAISLHLVVELLGHRGYICSILINITKYHSKMVEIVYNLIQLCVMFVELIFLKYSLFHSCITINSTEILKLQIWKPKIIFNFFICMSSTSYSANIF